MKHLIAFWMMLLSVSACAAQKLVDGWVRSEGSPLAGATVTLGSRHTLTDSAGYFRFEGLSPKRYHLHVSIVGFEPLHQPVVVDSTLRTMELSLEKTISSLDAVVVTGTMRPVQKLESPIAVEVYHPQFFRKNPTPSLFEGLQGVNGVRPQINCSVCNTGDIHINGLEGPYTMVTIDGMPIVSALSSVYGLFGLPVQLIDRVEVVKGPASGLYGSEAIGGLINIITKSPQKAPLFSANLMSTSWREHTADLGLRYRTGKKVLGLLGVHYFNYTRPEDRNGDYFTDVTLQHRISLFNKWNLERAEGRDASLALRYFYEDRWGGEMNWNHQHRGSDRIYGESIYTNRWELIGRYQLPVREQLHLSFSGTVHKQDSWYGITPYMGDQQVLFGQLLWDKTSGTHSLLAGLSGRYQYYDDNSTATTDTLTGINRPERTFMPGLFLQDEWKWNSSQTLLLGLRYDRHPVHGAILTPRFAFKWTGKEGNVVRLNGGTGFRVVHLFTEDHAALTGARAVEIREALKPERSYNLNLNYSRRFGGRSASLVVDAALWFSHFRNQIIADYETDPNKIIYDNLKGHAVSRGLTVNLDGSWRQRLKGMAGFTLQEVSRVESVGGKKLRLRPVLTERWSGTWALSYRFPAAGLTIDYTGNIYGPMRLPLLSDLDPRRRHSPVWSLQNLQLTKWISSRWEVFGGVKNLLNWTPAKGNPFLIARAHDPFDRKVEYDASGKVMATPENPYALTFDPSYVYASNQGRRTFAGFRFTLNR